MAQYRYIMAQNDLESSITSLLSGAKTPLSVSDLVERLGSAPRRNVQRALESLVKSEGIIRTGKARGTRYHVEVVAPRVQMPKSVPYPIFSRHSQPAVVRDEPDPPLPSHTPSLLETHAPLSEESKYIREIIRGEMAFRKPVGYRREFLDSYEPNVTRYLSESLSAELRHAGQSNDMANLPPGTYARTVLDRLLIDLSWNSSRLEGNTYSLLETDHLINQRKSTDGSRSTEAQMILNHKEAIEFLVEDPMSLGFNRYTFFNLHAILSQGLLKGSGGEGRIRNIPVMIGGTVFHPENTIPVVEECFVTILEKAGQIKDPLEAVLFIMVHIPYLQPFEDCNKRVSRIGCNLPLIQSNLAPFSFASIPKRDYTDAILAVYELNETCILSDVFAWAYRKSAAQYAIIREEIGEPDPVRVRYREELKTCVREVVVEGLDKPTAARAVRRWAKLEITASHQERFIEMAEALLISLSEGNIVRMRIRKSEFDAWWPTWIAKV